MNVTGPDSKTQPSKLKTQQSCVIALLGNPNTGKTTLFNALAGMRQRVGNYPGVTVETKKGHLTYGGRGFDLIDLPGTYSLAARSPDEMVAVDLILGQQPGEPKPDVVLSIVDASNLERNLYLTTQALELGVPVVVALNMMDVAAGQGLRLDVPRLSKQLGVPVVPIQANKGVGLERLKEVLAEAASPVLSTQYSVRRESVFPRRSSGKSITSTNTSAAGCLRSWCGACCSTWAVTPKSAWPRTTTTCRTTCRRPGGAWPRPAVRSPGWRRGRATGGFGRRRPAASNGRRSAR